jgi:hypothetical protein
VWTLVGLRTVLEGGSSIRRPGHFEDRICAFHPLDSEARAESPSSQVSIEAEEDRTESITLLVRECLPITLETASPLMSRHGADSVVE